MRVIAGRYGSRLIETRKSMATRPTLDKVREAVFSTLGGSFDGGVFIDLYAGSGANGFEALSRGMDEAWFIDSSHEAVRYIHKNAESLGCNDQCHILCMRDMTGLKLFKDSGKRADIIYMDPPYARQHNNAVLCFLEQNSLLKPDGIAVIESGREDAFHEEYEHLQFMREKIYGITRITYFKNQTQGEQQ